ncbi:MAG: hypothetical protein AB7S44_02220 [Spirochaetales bacterium]
MSLLEIFKSQYDVRVNPLNKKFDVFEFSKYFDETDNHYKHTLGVVGQVRGIEKSFDMSEQEIDDLEQIAFLHYIGYSKRVKHRGLYALDAAIFAIEKGLSEDIALTLMFHTAGQAEARHLGDDKIIHIYNEAHKLLAERPNVHSYIEIITFANLQTEEDGRPTSVDRRIFKMMYRYDKDTAIYKAIKENRKHFRKLAKKLRRSVTSKDTDTVQAF